MQEDIDEFHSERDKSCQTTRGRQQNILYHRYCGFKKGTFDSTLIVAIVNDW